MQQHLKAHLLLHLNLVPKFIEQFFELQLQMLVLGQQMLRLRVEDGPRPVDDVAVTFVAHAGLANARERVLPPQVSRVILYTVKRHTLHEPSRTSVIAIVVVGGKSRGVIRRLDGRPCDESIPVLLARALRIDILVVDRECFVDVFGLTVLTNDLLQRQRLLP